MEQSLCCHCSSVTLNQSIVLLPKGRGYFKYIGLSPLPVLVSSWTTEPSWCLWWCASGRGGRSYQVFMKEHKQVTKSPSNPHVCPLNHETSQRSMLFFSSKWEPFSKIRALSNFQMVKIWYFRICVEYLNLMVRAFCFRLLQIHSKKAAVKLNMFFSHLFVRLLCKAPGQYM